jgi:L-alanine-DL-glutamate epimerase-like enolase superfamily enzyme
MNNYRAVVEYWPIAGSGFATAREIKKDAIVAHLRLTRAGVSAEGESFALKRFGHTPDQVIEQIQNWLDAHKEWSRDVLEQTVEAGPARNAIDCALWRLEAAEHNMSFAAMAGIPHPVALNSAFTLSGAAPEAMARQAASKTNFRWIKVKLMGDGQDAQRLQAIHKAVPDKELIVDANESLDIEMLHDLMPVFKASNVVLIEQPLHAERDEALLHFQSPIPLAADESCHTIDSLKALVGKYRVVNLKLDKTGGLTHALKMKVAAREMGFGVMVGCMASTSLAIYPAWLLAQDGEFADLDGALLLDNDRDHCDKPELVF